MKAKRERRVPLNATVSTEARKILLDLATEHGLSLATVVRAVLTEGLSNPSHLSKRLEAVSDG